MSGFAWPARLDGIGRASDSCRGCEFCGKPAKSQLAGEGIRKYVVHNMLRLTRTSWRAAI